jgi:hypothetical protein
LNYCLCKDFACKACKELNDKKEYYNKNWIFDLYRKN